MEDKTLEDKTLEDKTLEDHLVTAVWNEDIQTTKMLLEQGANPNFEARSGLSAITCAAQNDQSGEIVKLLVNTGADINLQDRIGGSPVYYAIDLAIDFMIQHNRSTIDWSAVGVLLDLGADLSIKDNKGLNSYDLALAYGENGNSSFLKFMKKRELSKPSS